MSHHFIEMSFIHKAEGRMWPSDWTYIWTMDPKIHNMQPVAVKKNKKNLTLLRE